MFETFFGLESSLKQFLASSNPDLYRFFVGFPIDTQIQLNNGTEIQIKNGVTSFSGVPL